MIRLTGHSLDEIRIEFTGLRPGEKLYEELLAHEDRTLPTNIPLLRISKLRDDSGCTRVESWLAEVLDQNNPQSLRLSLQELLPSEYVPRD
jgi:FlaA1/EpsC-like NDP-sugar epimerase